MANNEIAREIAERLCAKKAKDITIIDIAEKSSFADFFVNATAVSERQLKALGEEVEELTERLGIEMISSDGREGSGWLLLDYGDIIVNIFAADMRDVYALDKLWSDCDITHIEG